MASLSLSSVGSRVMKNSPANPLHVVHVVDWSRSGIGQFVLNLLKASKDSPGRPNQTVVMLRYDGQYRSLFSDAGASVVCPDNEAGEGLKRLLIIKKKISELRPDVVHVHSLMPHIVSYIALKDHPKFVATIHNDYPYFKRLSLKDKIKFFVQASLIRNTNAHLVAISKRVENCVRACFKANDISLIYNGVNVPESYLKPTSENSETQDLKLVSVGRLDNQKGFENLIGSISILRDKGLPITLALVGSGPEEKKLKELIRSLSLEGQVFLKGYQEDPLAFVTTSDLYVCSSIYEGFGLAIVEAMMCGIPVLSTRVGIACEVIKDGINGFLVQNNTVDALASKIETAYYEKPSLRKLGLRGQKGVRETFVMQRCADEYMKLYEGI